MNESFVYVLNEASVHAAALVYACLQADQIEARSLEDPRTFCDECRSYLQGLSRLDAFLDENRLEVDAGRWLYLGADFWRFLYALLQQAPTTRLAAALPDASDWQAVPMDFLFRQLASTGTLPAEQKQKLFRFHHRIRFSPAPIRICFSSAFLKEHPEPTVPLPAFFVLYQALSFPRSFETLQDQLPKQIDGRFASGSITHTCWMDTLQRDMDAYAKARKTLLHTNQNGVLMTCLDAMEQIQLDWACLHQRLAGQPVSYGKVRAMRHFLRILCESLNIYL